MEKAFTALTFALAITAVVPTVAGTTENRPFRIGAHSAPTHETPDLLYVYNWQNPRRYDMFGPPPPQKIIPKFRRRPPGAVDARRAHRARSAVFDEGVLAGLAAIVTLGIFAQWLAVLFRVPSAVLLLLSAALFGPVLNWLNPDLLLADLLLPILSLLIAVTLYHEGLRMRLKDFGVIAPLVQRRASLGLLTTWLVVSAAAMLAGVSLPLAILFGATIAAAAPSMGLSQVSDEPPSDLSAILDSEEAVINVLGASVIALLSQALLFATTSYPQDVVIVLVNLLWVGGVVGFLGAAFLLLLTRRNWIPAALRPQITVAIVLAVFSIATWLQSDSGFLAAGVMGFVLANQRAVPVATETAPKQATSTLLLGTMLVLLFSRLRLVDVDQLNWAEGLVLVGAVLVAQPLAVTVSTLGLESTWSERLQLAWSLPRGVVAAGVCTIAAMRLADKGMPQAVQLLPMIMLFVALTIVLDLFIGVLRARRVPIAAPVNPQRSKPMIAG